MERQQALAHRVNRRPRWTTMEFSWAHTGISHPLLPGSARSRCFWSVLASYGEFELYISFNPEGTKEQGRSSTPACVRGDCSAHIHQEGRSSAEKGARRWPMDSCGLSFGSILSSTHQGIFFGGRCSSSFKLGGSRDPSFRLNNKTLRIARMHKTMILNVFVLLSSSSTLGRAG